MTTQIKIDGRLYLVQLVPGETPGSWRCRLTQDRDGAGTREFELDVRETQPGVLSLLVDGRSYEVRRETTHAGMTVSVGSRRYCAEVADPRSLRTRRAAGNDKGPQKITAPMPGKVVRILVPEGNEVREGQGVLVIEAMKMQNELRAARQGIVRKIMVKEGAAANAGDVLAVVE
jgi:biotin carboxyl carrier protein